MSDRDETQVQSHEDELDVDELDEVAGGAPDAPIDDVNNNCGNNCHCG